MAKKRGKNKLPTQSVEVQVVTSRHRVPCVKCTGTRLPTGKRLVIEKGAGRYAKRIVYCNGHGVAALNEIIIKCGDLCDQLLQKPGDE